MIKILLVEDDKIIVASLSEYLNSEGYLVRSVSGQTAAMKLLAEEKVDLVLLDVSLAEGNGFAACRAIKSEFDLPVIFLTASGDEFSTVRASIWAPTITFQSRFARESLSPASEMCSDSPAAWAKR